MYEHRSSKLLPLRDFIWRMVRHAGAAAVIVVVSLGGGVVGYHWLGRLGWVDAFLNASMILGGMGPVNDLPTSAAKIFAGCYALYSGVIFIAVAGILLAPVVHRIAHRMHLQ